MEDIYKWKVNSFTCGMVLGALAGLSFSAYLVAAHLEHVAINIELWSIFYPGFAMTPLGVLIGVAWVTLDAFFVGFGLTMLYNLIAWFRDRSKARREYDANWFEDREKRKEEGNKKESDS